MFRNTALFCILSLSCLAACDDAPSSNPPPSGVEGYVSQYADAYCEGLFACAFTDYGTYGAGAERSRYASEADCRADLGRWFGREFSPDFTDALERGSVRYDAEAAARCLESLRGLGPTRCEGVTSWEGACSRVFVGTRAEGQFCRFDRECVTGTVCRDGATGCGTCVADPTVTRPGPGEACGYPASCQEGSHCARLPGHFGSVCFEDSRTTVAKAGEPCGALSDTTRAVCERGTFCGLAPSSTVGVCLLPLTIGQSCGGFEDDDRACELGSVCGYDESGFDSGPRCRKVTIHTVAGEPCNPEGPSTDVCSTLHRLRCDDQTLRCVSIGDGSAGSDCFSEKDCDDGLVCDRVCMRPLANGLPCSEADECASGFCQKAPNLGNGVCSDLPSAPICQ